MTSIWNSIYTRFALCIVVDIVVYLVLLATLQDMVNKATPPEGFVFERLPVVTGVYSCCGSGKFQRSELDNSITLSCAEPDFIQGVGSYSKYGSQKFSCGLEKELNGQNVEVYRLLTPTISFFTPGSTVFKIVSHGQVFYERDDKELRTQWIETSNASIVGFAQTICMYLLLILILIFANPKKLLEKMYG